MAKTPTTFAIDFDTKSHKGYVTAVKVTLERDVVEMDETVRVDLCNHPLYPHLVRYVQLNPIPGGRR